MSKHIYWFALAAAGLFAAACSDNDALDSSSAVSDGSSTFMAVNIYMTSDAATRSSSTVSSDGYATGTSEEYAIDLTKSVFLFYDSNGDFLTSTTEVTSSGGTETSGTNESDYVEYTYSAMLVLGPTTLTPAYVVGIFNDANAQTAYDGLSLDKLQEALFNSDNELEATDDNAGILMSNAVKYSDGSFSFATGISEENICTSSETALESPVEMYIERAKAKVEIGITAGNFTSNEREGTYTYTITKTGDNSDTDSTFTYYYVDDDGNLASVANATVDITINGWAVNALNKTGYVIKNYTNDEGTELSSGITSSSKGGAWGSDWYSSLRIFWAVDGNYAAEASTDDDWALQYKTWSAVEEGGCSTDAAYYYEQTLDPDATTGYIAGETAYAPTLLVAATVSVNTESSSEETTTEGKTRADDDDSSDDEAEDIFIWYGSVLYSQAAVYAKILSTLSSIEGVSLADGETISSIEWETDDASTGSVYISSITMSNNTDVSDYIDQVNSSSSLINYSEETSSSSTLRRYNGGACYYQVPIQTYITSSSSPYGLVRNTAYSITINSVTGIGAGVNDPDEDELTEIPGEDTNYCIGAKINILAWRLSSQEVDL